MTLFVGSNCMQFINSLSSPQELNHMILIFQKNAILFKALLMPEFCVPASSKYLLRLTKLKNFISQIEI